VIHARILPAAAIAGLLALSACDRDKAEAPARPAEPGQPPPSTGGPAAPLAFAEATPYAKVSLSLPAGVASQPELHVPLYAEEMRKLRQFQEGAQSDRTEAGSEEQAPAYEKTIQFKPAAETGKLLSLVREDFDYSGGVHPNTVTTGLMWDKAIKRRIGVGELFRPGADLRSLDQALCSALNVQKAARDPKARLVTLDGSDFRCPRAADTPFVLAPSTVGGKAGGLIFLVGPYQIGPYVEGAYEATLPQALFRGLLNPAYADEFAGEPRS